MCGRYTLSATPQEIMDEFGLIEPPFTDTRPRYNIAPTEDVLAVVGSRAGLKGGMLRAKYGKGTYIYTGYAFFRQLPAGVPGAYRLFANMVSLRDVK